MRTAPKVEFGAQTRLSAPLRAQLQKDYVAQYDFKHGGWGFVQKFLEWNSAEYALASFLPGDRNERMARQALTGQLHLIDPVWGGAYQYSTGGDWNEPHFEKIMAVQTEDLRLFSLGYAQWHDPSYLKAATGIEHFLATFLRSPEGAFYTSQDADVIDGQHSAEYFKLDDPARRRQGTPRVDQHLYAPKTAGPPMLSPCSTPPPASGGIWTRPWRRPAGSCRIAACPAEAFGTMPPTPPAHTSATRWRWAARSSNCTR